MSGSSLAQSTEHYTATGHRREAVALVNLARAAADRQHYEAATALAALATAHASIAAALVVA